MIVNMLGLRLNLLSLPLRSISWLLPTTYVGAGVRKAWLHHPTGVYGAWVATYSAALVGSTVVGGCRAMLIFGRSLDAGRSRGVPAGY